MPRIGPTELILILVIVLIVFGAGKLPQIGSALGKGIKEFKQGTRDEVDSEPKKAAANDAASQPKK